jgi:hypothetical protein
MITVHAFLQQLAKGQPPGRLPLRLPQGRHALPMICRQLRYRRGAEVGVWKGAFSALFAQAGLHMTCVDPWRSTPDWNDGKNRLPPDEANRVLQEACETATALLVPLGCALVRQPSLEAAAGVPDRSLDFVYIDGNHGRDAVLADLEAWAPKVRRGGLVAGHDYRLFKHKPEILVVEAVRAYTDAHAIAPWYLLAGDKTPSYLWAVA